MQTLPLSWDLLILVFFAIVMSYSFLIGKDQSVTLMIAVYIAAIATQGIGHIVLSLIGSTDAVLRSVGIPGDPTVVPITKIFVFTLCIIIFLTRSGICLTHEKDTGNLLGIIYTTLFGFAIAGLMLSTILTYLGGTGILDRTIHAANLFSPFLLSGAILQLLILHQDLWYTLPAFLIIVVGLVHRDR